jgi:hypothetical protein
MSSGIVCPACGLAVVPGYVRCPKCHKPLPRRAGPSAMVGGTAVETTRKSPMIVVIAIALAGGAVIAYLGLRSTESPKKAAPAPAMPVEQPETPAADVAQPAPAEPAQAGPSQEQAAASAASQLERELKKQRLWSTVQIFGSRVEVRSGSCSDPAMAAALDASASTFKAAGLTKLRCLEQSGQVVTDRDL